MPPHDITLGTLPWWTLLRPGRFKRYRTRRSPTWYVVDTETGTHMRLETAMKRWPKEFE